ncbi:MAG: hypothetical protein D4R69_03705 [Actinomycetales bacterium]|nr:MAG: hypothetical protein D4R69_03705 [Actinomycetales bacterium]
MSDSIKNSHELLAEFIKNGENFISTARSIREADLAKTPIAGEWSAAFVLHHMCDGDLHFATRYLYNLAEDNPEISPFNEDIYPDRINYAKRDPLASLAAIEGIFQAVKNILAIVPEGDWLRTSVHAERGVITLAGIVSIAAGHSKAHANQLRTVIEAL